jgi:multicomponent Na+:H+ antiporter subunit F
MTLVFYVAFAGVVVWGLLCALRLMRGPSLTDRIVALDALLIVIVSGIAIDAAYTGDGIYLDVLVVAALLGFIGTVNVARFIEKRGT